MNLEQYAALHAQDAQQEQQTQEVLTVEQLAAKLDAERLSSLTAQLQEAISEGAAPAAMLTQIAGALFGPSSPQAAAVAAIIDKAQHPGGHEMAIAEIRQRRRLLRQQAKQLDEQAKAIEAEITRLDAEERALVNAQADTEGLDTALIDALTVCKGADPQRPDMLQQLERLYTQHHSSPAAMGLLYGCLADLTRRQYSAGALDIVQQARFDDLKARVAAAIST